MISGTSQFRNSLGTQDEDPALHIENYWDYRHCQFQNLFVLKREMKHSGAI